MKKNKNKDPKFKIPVEGSLGLFAYGDIGLISWRKVKTEFYKKNK